MVTDLEPHIVLDRYVEAGLLMRSAVLGQIRLTAQMKPGVVGDNDIAQALGREHLADVVTLIWPGHRVQYRINY